MRTARRVWVPPSPSHCPSDPSTLPAAQVGAAPQEGESASGANYAEEALRWLPAVQAEQPAVAQPHAHGRIVVADDNPDMREYVCRLLGAHWEVVPVANGEEALASVRERKPDLLLTDVMMPKLDGFGLLRAIRADAALGDLPVMMLSARAGEEARVGGLEAGADDYLVKPFSARELVARVRSNLELAAVRRAAGAALRASEERLRDLNGQLAQRVAEAGEQDRRKNEFLATLAHELRNPLAPLRNGVELMKRFGVAQPQRVPDIVAMMERQLAHMVRLVDDLMDIARVSRGKVELRQERVPLAGIVESALEGCRPQAERAGHALTVDVPAAPVWLFGDPTRLAQVLGNVLNNAVKYTPPHGHIALRARMEDSTAVIEVQDDGVGIAPELAGNVFDLFVQGPQTLAAAQGGLGIGLSLVRQLVEMHGGSVALRSEGAGRGTTVRISLPLAPAQAAPRAGAQAAETQASGRGQRVLVVDDNVDAANSLGLLLAIGGHETCVVHSGQEALSAASSFRPQLVLLDIGLPDLSGYEVATRLRQAQDGSPLRIVALTGWGNEAAREKSASSGFDLHLTKPVQMDVLQQLLRDGA
ncbi:ATP-binding response regulator [Ramlibacter agri]|uniref:ATP-binding response regulator n=1 Tax=Ramlibacter agri TaxID=2728837 RepID=UPI001F0D77BE|nr:response regulator [Ramlibacter agri]